MAVAVVALWCALPTSGAEGRGGATGGKASRGAKGEPTFEGCVASLTSISTSLGWMSPAPGATSFARRYGSSDAANSTAGVE